MEVLTHLGYRNIADLEIGETLIGIDGKQNALISKRAFPKEWFEEQGLDEWKWYLINGTHKLFRNQNIFVKYGDFNICHAFELQVGWIISDVNGNDLEILSIEETTPNNEWWSLELSGDHSFISSGLILHNASRYWVGGGASANWSATGNTNWSATSGGANNASVPSSTDDVTFDGAGGSGNSSSTVSATITNLSFTVTSGYTQTITRNAVQTIAGNYTDNTSYSIGGSSGITISATSTITSGGQTFPNGVTFTGASTTKTLVGNWTIGGTLTIGASSQTLNKTTTETLTSVGLTASNACVGTAEIILSGGTWSSSGTSAISNNLTFAGNVTISGTVVYSTGILKRTSGTITTTSSTLTLNSSCTLDLDGVTLSTLTATASNTAFTITMVNSKTLTISTALTINGHRFANPLTFVSDDGTLKSNLVLSQGATCNTNAFFTRIDASGGRPINTWNGTITSCTNINQFTDLRTVGF